MPFFKIFTPPSLRARYATIVYLSVRMLSSLQFGFRKQYSTSHALINITKNIRKALDDGNIGCGVFVDFQKAFETVDHQILLEKLNHYKICEFQRMVG